METWWIKSERIVFPDGISPGAILVEKGKIQAIRRGPNAAFSEGERMDVGDHWIVPGLIDMHIHGSGGWAVGSPDPKDLLGLSDYLPSVGVTAFQPSTSGAMFEDLIEELGAIATAMDRQTSGARMIGIHMEGTFLNPKKKGAFPAEVLLKPTVEKMQAFLDAGQGKIQHVSMAPEIEGAEAVIRFLRDKGILVAGAHTDATYEETMRGIEWGVALSNHTCNAQRSIHHRDPGALGAYLLSDVDCELISDFVHVHPQMMEMIRRLKGIEKIALVSDAILAAGVAPGHYSFRNRAIIIGEEGGSTLPDGTIAGSTGNLLMGFQNWVKVLGVSMEEASVMASRNPARITEVLDRKGSIEIGKDADLLVLDSDLSLDMTVCEGRVAYRKDEKKDRTNPAFREYLVQ
jgi:N-acetylglucosamine-6-phosphate deacetylase